MEPRGAGLDGSTLTWTVRPVADVSARENLNKRDMSGKTKQSPRTPHAAENQPLFRSSFIPPYSCPFCARKVLFVPPLPSAGGGQNNVPDGKSSC